MKYQSKIKVKIRSSLSTFLSISKFKEDIKVKALAEAICFNNSFLGRKNSSTNKNSFYLGSDLKNFGKGANIFLVDRKSTQNSDYKFIFPSEMGDTKKIDLDKEISNQLKKSNSLLVTLVSKLKLTESKTAINTELFSALSFEPNLQKRIRFLDKRIQVSSLDDVYGCIEDLRDHLESKKVQKEKWSSYEKEFESAYKILGSECHFIPQIAGSTSASDNVMGMVGKSLRLAVKEYREHLKIYQANPLKSADEYRQLLRIAYNYSSEAKNVVNLMSEVSDLRPIVLWCVIGDFAILENSLKSFCKSKQGKIGIEDYHHEISKVRSGDFHNLISLSAKISIDLKGINLKNHRLTIFSKYQEKGHNKISFEEEKMMNVITTFTRPDKIVVGEKFFVDNLDVMLNILKLTERFSEILILLKHYEAEKTVNTARRK